MDSLPGDRDRETSGMEDFRRCEVSGGDVLRGESAREETLLSGGGKPAAENIADSRLDMVSVQPS